MTNAALREIFSLQTELDGLTSRPHITKEQRKRADIIMARIAALRDMGMSTDEAHRALANEYGREIGAKALTTEPTREERLFRDFLRGAPDAELQQRATTFITGPDATGKYQSISYTAGPAGGFLVPMSFYQSAAEGMAAIDPLLDPEIVTVVQEPDYSLRPLQLPGWDLSAVAAVKVGEIAQESAAAIPSMDQPLLNKYAYRIALDASLEWDTDATAYGDAMTALGRAIGVAMARGIGADLVTGNGSSAPQGILTGAANSGVTTAAAGVLGLADFNSIFFSVNKAYRESPKAAWLVNDATMKIVRNAVDGNGRPLINLEVGTPMILGKPVYVCPSLPSGVGSKGIVFGDLSYFYVHASNMLLRRLLQVPGLIENGKVRYHALQMVDAVVNDPTSGSLPPIVYATLHA